MELGRAPLPGSIFLRFYRKSPSWQPKLLAPRSGNDIRFQLGLARHNEYKSSRERNITGEGNKKSDKTSEWDLRPLTRTLDPLDTNEWKPDLMKRRRKSQLKCTFLFFFSLTVPPQPVVIFDETGSPRTTFVGPYREGTNMKLICDAFNGEWLWSLFILRIAISTFN